MRGFSPLELVAAHPWRSALFTTFSLSLSYFEAVVLDALVRRNVERKLILADVEGVRAALSEHGARHAGRSYQVEPVAVANGCFHAKLTALTAPGEGHLVVGSGNLTVGGWGVNLECAEHLHPSFAADAFDDAAEFLESLATTANARHGAVDACGNLAVELRGLAAGGRRTGDIRLVSNIDGSIIDRLAEFADGLGGARRLTVVSPFFDSGAAVDRLCGALGLDEVSVHSHPTRPVSGTGAANWPRDARTGVRAVAAEPFEEDARHLHAKVFEVLCGRGRIVMSGSANATSAALLGGRNIELSVVRLHREPSVGWRLSPSAPPEAEASAEEDETDGAERRTGILRATLRGDELRGEVLTGFPEGEAAVLQMTGLGPKDIVTAKVVADGSFSVTARGLEMEGWSAQRLVVRLRSKAPGEPIAEGFVAFPDIAEVTRRAGAVAGRLLAILAGTETPADVAAVMAWFCDNPSQLRQGIGGGGRDGSEPPAEREIDVRDLLEPPPTPGGAGYGMAAAGSVGWERFMAQVLGSFRAARGPIAASAASAETVEEESTPTPDEAEEAERATSAFDRLFELLLGGDGGRRDLGLALRLGQYVCDRLEPPEPVVEGYLTRLLGAMSGDDVPESDRPAFAAAILVAAARRQKDVPGPAACRNARHRLLRLGQPIEGPAPDMAEVRGFARLLVPELDAEGMWAAVGAVRTFQEEVALYRRAEPGPLRDEDFPALASLPEWRELSAGTPAVRRSVRFMDRYSEVCPAHFINLPSSEKAALRDHGVARAGNCCRTIIMCEEV